MNPQSDEKAAPLPGTGSQGEAHAGTEGGDGPGEIYRMREAYQKGLRIMAWVALLIGLIWGIVGGIGVSRTLDELNPVPGLALAVIGLGTALTLLAGAILAFRSSQWACLPFGIIGVLGLAAQLFKVLVSVIMASTLGIVDLAVLLLFAALAVGSVTSAIKAYRIRAAGLDPRERC